MFNDQFVRKEIYYQLLHPTEDWGPALPENRRRYSSSSSQRKHHPSGDNIGDDDVFGKSAELTSMKPLDPDAPAHEKDRLVHFEDENTKESKTEAPVDVSEGSKDNVKNEEKGDDNQV